MKTNAPGRETTSKRLRARYMIVVKGYSQKEAAELVGISERTIGTWVKKFNWQEQKEFGVFKVGGFTAIIDGFLAYVKQERPLISADAAKLWKAYLKTLEKEFKD